MKVRGTQKEKPREIEVNVDTVYVRKNIQRIESDDFVGWEYEELRYDKDKYIELVSNENSELKIRLDESENAILTIMDLTLMGGI